jgi:hypothetical protein
MFASLFWDMFGTLVGQPPYRIADMRSTTARRRLWGEKLSSSFSIELFGRLSPNPAPDLLHSSLAGDLIFVTLRGPNPLTGNAPGINNAAGSTPGLGIMQVKQGGRQGELRALIPITHLVDGIEQADPHGVAVRRK